MKNSTLILCFVILFTFFSCKYNIEPDLVEDTNLHLQFNAYLTGTNENALLGLDWALAQIGAKKTNASFGGISQNEDILTIDIEHLGFDENAKFQLNKLHQKIKNSQEYKTNNNIDLGRYVALILGASEHYYAITNVPKKLEEITVNYVLLENKGYVDNSLVSEKHRIIEFSEQEGLKQFLITTEIEPSTQEVLEYETIEIMENGHLRFGIFDENGNRKNNAKPSVSSAGKPGKCMWCHESNISRLFSPQNDFSGYLSYIDLKNTLGDFVDTYFDKKLALTDGVDFSESQNHKYMELLYISFMEPSIQVLSKEWNISVTEVQNRLISLQTHEHEEFDFLGAIYYRNEIESFAPFTSLQVSSNVREQSQTEVNHIE